MGMLQVGGAFYALVGAVYLQFGVSLVSAQFTAIEHSQAGHSYLIG
jgi:hypothetical protein